MGQTINIAAAAAKLNTSEERVRVLCRSRRIPGARFVGRAWSIPEDFKVTEPQRGPRASYTDRQMAANPIRLRIGVELDLYVSEDSKRLVVTRARAGSITKERVAQLIRLLEGYRDQMI